MLGAGVLTFRMIKRYGFDLMELGLGLCLLLGLPELRPLFINLEKGSQAHRAQADGWPECPGTSDGQGDLSRSIPYPAGSRFLFLTPKREFGLI